MTVDEAFQQIALLTQAETEPKLTLPELKLLLKRSLRVDAARRVPSDNLWTPTFNIAMSVALGWEMKAQKCATGYDFQSADQRFSRSQMYAQLMKVANEWRKRGGESIRLKGDLRQINPFPSINGPDEWWPLDQSWQNDNWWTWAESLLPGQR